MKVDNPEGLGAYYDGELSPEETACFEKQLQTEPELRQELESYKRVSELISQLPKFKVPFDLTKSVLERAKTEAPSPFALTDSPADWSFLNDSDQTSNGESAQEAISKESENNYVDDWQPPTIRQRISRAMLWPTMVIIIALGLYLSKPKENVNTNINTNPDESEIADFSANESADAAKPLESSIPFVNPPADLNGGPVVNAVQDELDATALSDAAAPKTDVLYRIECRIDASVFNAEKWISTLKELGVEIEESEAPLEVGVWKLFTAASQRAEALSVLKSVPGVISAETSANAATTPTSKEESVLTEIRLLPIEK